MKGGQQDVTEKKNLESHRDRQIKVTEKPMMLFTDLEIVVVITGITEILVFS